LPDIPCSKCRRPAIIFQRYSGLHLCKNHFIVDFEAKAKRAVRIHRWIHSGDRIAVALSGGKDSSALLYFLSKLLGKRRDISLFAITIDEGIQGYRDSRVAADIAGKLGIEHLTASFSEEFGISLDEIVKDRGDRLSCSFCGILRRQILNRTARLHGATRLARGFYLDDEAQSVLMNVLRGDIDRLLRQMRPVEGLIPRIKPFLYIPEREVALYAFLHVEGFELGRCPYSHNALRADVRTLLNDYSWRHPATKYSLVNLGEHLVQAGTPSGTAGTICQTCGEPFIGECQPCRIISEVLHDRC
jgi:uncharacterized protein (TIGR00269 family)